MKKILEAYYFLDTGYKVSVKLMKDKEEGLFKIFVGGYNYFYFEDFNTAKKCFETVIEYRNESSKIFRG